MPEYETRKLKADLF